MHYCALLITKEIPTENEISDIMKPYCEENAEYDKKTEKRISEYPVFEWDWYQIGGRYNGSLKLKVDIEDTYYDWKYYAKEERNKRLFYSYLLTKMKNFSGNTFMYTEEDYYRSMGRNDGFLYVDGARINDLLNFDEVECYICIDIDGNAIARETWNGSTFIKDEQFDEKLKEIKDKSKNYFVTVLDIHD